MALTRDIWSKEEMFLKISSVSKKVSNFEKCFTFKLE